MIKKKNEKISPFEHGNTTIFRGSDGKLHLDHSGDWVWAWFIGFLLIIFIPPLLAKVGT